MTIFSFNDNFKRPTQNKPLFSKLERPQIDVFIPLKVSELGRFQLP